MSQAEKAKHFAELHQRGNPLVLYNIWDAGGAKAVQEAGAAAVATGSWSMAAAHGYDDGESIPLDFVLRIVERICDSVNVPVTVDFEGGYATDPDEVAENVREVIRAGAVGINFEDRIVKGEGLHSISPQAARIRAIKAAAADESIPLVLNARTDLFLGTDPASHEAHLAEAMERAAAYAEAGADCFFVPGLTDTAIISHVTANAGLPVNVMMMGELKSIKDVASAGVSRASYGPGPFFEFLANLKTACTSIE
ncbi:isocitrate lyase/PEP mutase family protein [Roseobacter sp. EG26]|uniref:isocitrate lyase/PEP mutase family protein n=1 Tax=Roseobacter sp. EG26 TaxID=3412477 RepID=UPI003CE49062